MAFLSEAALEQALLQQLGTLKYCIEAEEVIGPDGSQPERESHDQVILTSRLAEAVARINPHVPEEARLDAIRKLTQTEFPTLLEENRRIHKLMTEGADVEYYDRDGTLKAGKVNLIDFENLDNNDWLAVNQFVVIAGTYNRRPDVVVFVNGMPLAVIELKAPGSDNATVVSAFNQLQTYKSQIPALFTTNTVLITSDGLTARIGSLSADIERYMPWRTTDGKDVAPKGTPEQQTLIEGVLERGRLLQLLRDFTVFGETKSGLAKIIAGYHQFHAVNHAVTCTIKASRPEGDKRAGVIWHTQGSGKSLLMAFYAGQLVRHSDMANPTLVVLTDRNDLDDQLFGTFSMCQDLIRQRPEQANSREDLQKILSRSSGGVVFTTIQKFSPDAGTSTYPVLTDRRNVIVIVDEA
ncbi:MAG: HsdR family type I site-specific deoxyribonuclease, partial [Pseudohongiella sp.]|nr:HsdR family type I site-specific deoxyribonuclease [Pseudohongiella sp.]